VKRVLLALVVLLGVSAIGVWAGISAYEAGSAQTDEVTAAAQDQAYTAAYDTSYEGAYQKAYDAAYATAAKGSREEAYQQAYDEEYEKAYRANYIASYAKEAMEFQCEGAIANPEADQACKSSAYAQAERAYQRLER
jgi:hypothetical protein